MNFWTFRKFRIAIEQMTRREKNLLGSGFFMGFGTLAFLSGLFHIFGAPASISGYFVGTVILFLICFQFAWDNLNRPVEVDQG